MSLLLHIFWPSRKDLCIFYVVDSFLVRKSCKISSDFCSSYLLAGLKKKGAGPRGEAGWCLGLSPVGMGRCRPTVPKNRVLGHVDMVVTSIFRHRYGCGNHISIQRLTRNRVVMTMQIQIIDIEFVFFFKGQNIYRKGLYFLM